MDLLRDRNRTHCVTVGGPIAWRLTAAVLGILGATVPMALVGSALPASASIGTQAVSGIGPLFSVACPTTTLCEAVGQNEALQGVVVPINSGIPGSPQPVPSIAILFGMACPTATTCEAVGERSTSDGGGVVVGITRGLPGSPQTVSGNSALVSVACHSSSTCEAVGIVPPVGVLIRAGLPGSPQGLSGTESLGDVACPTATTCDAVGESSSGGVIVPITDGTLGSPQAVPGTADLSGIACPTATTCEAVGYNSSFEGVAVSTTNGIPATAKVVSGPAGAAPTAVSGGGVLTRVACTSATTCEAVGDGATGGLIVPITNGTPGTPQVVSDTTLNSVACPTANICIAVGSNSNSGPGEGLVVAFTATAAPASLGASPSPSATTSLPPSPRGSGGGSPTGMIALLAVLGLVVVSAGGIWLARHRSIGSSTGS